MPLIPLLAKLPGFSLLRVPSRALFISNIAGIMIVCEVLSSLVTSGERIDRKVSILVMTVIVLLAVLLSLGLWLMMGEIPFEMGYGSAAILLAFLILVLLIQGQLKVQVGFAMLLLLLVLDLGTINHCSMDFWSFEKAVAQGADAAAFLAEKDGMFRVYSPSYSLPQHTAVLNGLELADGIDPLQSRVYSEYMEAATGVDSPVYSVTIPAFADGKVSTANKGAVPDAELLGKLNVRYVVSAYEMDAPGLVLEEQFDETYIYQNARGYPRAWVETSGEINEVSMTENTSNQVQIEADGPGLLVVSEMMYPGWGVDVDGMKQEIKTVNGIFRGVELSEGSHDVVFTFRPLSVKLGCLTGVLAWLVMGFYFFFSRGNRASV